MMIIQILKFAFWISLEYFMFVEFLSATNFEIEHSTFTIKWSRNKNNAIQTSKYEKVEMLTSNKEKYHCMIPKNIDKLEGEKADYGGGSVIEILRPLLQSNKCLLMLQPFWTYELCFRTHVKQYHLEKSTLEKENEYILGQINVNELSNNESHYKTGEITVDKATLPYFGITYVNGTICDLTKLPRITNVLFMCDVEAGNDGTILHIKEIYSCEYEIAVITSRLCSHPKYQQKKISEIDINCYSETWSKYPENLRKLDKESLMLRQRHKLYEFDFEAMRKYIEKLEYAEKTLAEKFIDIITTIVKKKAEIPSLHPPPNPTVDSNQLNKFLRGEQCLEGGTGWWKYEFCYGKTVNQFHADKTGYKIVINLGKFNINDHKEWASQLKSRLKNDKNEVRHFYSMGDFCDSVNEPRNVVVRLKCKPKMSASGVSMYLLESKTCQYDLTVESSFMCPLFDHIDDFNLFTTANLLQKKTENIVREKNIKKSSHIDL